MSVTQLGMLGREPEVVRSAEGDVRVAVDVYRQLLGPLPVEDGVPAIATVTRLVDTYGLPSFVSAVRAVLRMGLQDPAAHWRLVRVFTEECVQLKEGLA